MKLKNIIQFFPMLVLRLQMSSPKKSETSVNENYKTVKDYEKVDLTATSGKDRQKQPKKR